MKKVYTDSLPKLADNDEICQYLDGKGNKCNNHAILEKEIFEEVTIYEDRSFSVFICEKHLTGSEKQIVQELKNEHCR